MGEKHTGICMLNSAEIHDSKDLVYMQHNLVYDVMDGIQTNLSQTPHYLANFLKSLMTFFFKESKLF